MDSENTNSEANSIFEEGDETQQEQRGPINHCGHQFHPAKSLKSPKFNG